MRCALRRGRQGGRSVPRFGHYGLAFTAKRVAPRTSLGATFFAAQFLDELCPILLLAGIERVRILPGLMAANVLDFESYPYSHSLVAALAWAVLIPARARSSESGCGTPCRSR